MNSKEQLNYFLSDINCLKKLTPWLDTFNIFDVLKISRTEIRHSNMLAWLLNPRGNHGLGDSFLKEIFQMIIANKINVKNDSVKILKEDFSKTVILREWENIDILCKSDHFVIVIENKIDSSEHDNQLERYYNIVEKKYTNQKKIYIYLTPNGELPSDTIHWNKFSYSKIVHSLKKVFDEKKEKLQEGQKNLINDYINTLKRNVIMDEELIKVCTDIYKNHKEALDLIFEYKNNFITDTIKNVIIKKKDKPYKFDLVDKNLNQWVYFSSKSMDNILPNVDNPKGGTWNIGKSYLYWIYIDKNQIYGAFELGGIDLNKKQIENQKKIFTSKLWEKAPNQNESYQCKQIFATPKYEIDISEPETIENATNEILDEIANHENAILNIFKSK